MFLVTLFPADAHAERIFLAGYNGGFYIRSEEEGGMDMRLGGSYWVDYRYYAEGQRNDDRFDVRRARIFFNGQLTKWFRYNLEYEFLGTDVNHLKDAYLDFVFNEQKSLRFGQFKEPFSLEWQTPDRAIPFAERSMGNALTPGRDVGVMLFGSPLKQSVSYGVGLFNGNGVSGSNRGDDHDSPEVTSRLTIKPFMAADLGILRSFQVGGSASYAKINTVNIDLKVKSTGMVNLNNRNIYVFGVNNYKFGVLQDVDSRMRVNAETAWVSGPVALSGEAFHLKYTDIRTAERSAIDADFSSYYLSLAYCVTGEEFSLANGVINPIYPKKFFNPDEGTYGALVLAARYDHFTGDDDWIPPLEYVSVRHADAVSMCATWILFPMLRALVDYTYTDLSDPIKVKVNDDGSIDYINRENVLTLRFCLDL